MTPYRLSTPPRSPGIYALKNRLTGHIYIGQSLNLYRRFEEWRGLLRAGMGKSSKLFMELARSSSIDDWDFVILAHVPRERATKLSRMETQAIQKTTARIGELCLNCHQNRPAPNPERAIGKANPRKSTITDETGEPMSYGAVAARLGVTHQAIKKRMQTARCRGVFQLKLEDLVGPPASA